MSIDYKSTGTLFNELITTRLKLKNIGPKEEFKQRENDLIEALGKRRAWIERLPDIINDINDLSEVLEKLWWEQEVLYENVDFDDWSYYHGDWSTIYAIGKAGINSIKLNRERSELTRKIDSTLGESSSTVLEKSWK